MPDLVANPEKVSHIMPFQVNLRSSLFGFVGFPFMASAVVLGIRLVPFNDSITAPSRPFNTSCAVFLVTSRTISDLSPFFNCKYHYFFRFCNLNVKWSIFVMFNEICLHNFSIGVAVISFRGQCFYNHICFEFKLLYVP